MLCYVIAVVILQTFYLGKLDLLTVYLGKLIFQNVTNFSQSKFYRLELGYVMETIETSPMTATPKRYLGKIHFPR